MIHWLPKYKGITDNTHASYVMLFDIKKEKNTRLPEILQAA